jgi:hypothetical protein
MLQSPLRLLATLTIPLIAAAFVTVSGILILASSTLNTQNNELHQSTANQIARVAADYLAKRDLLSLNVILDDLSREQPISLTAIYDPQNKLLVQSGLTNPRSTRLTSDIRSQTEYLGRLVIEFDDQTNSSHLVSILLTAVAAYSLIVAIVCLIGYFFGDFLILWITAQARPRPATTDRDSTPDNSNDLSTSCTLLAVKLMPHRLIPGQEILEQCQQLHGHLYEISRGEYEAQFRTGQHLRNCLEFTIFIEHLVTVSEGRLQAKMALAQGLFDDHETITKRVRYMASLSPGKPLINRSIYDELTGGAGETGQPHDDPSFSHYDIQPFHSPMASDIELFSLEAGLNEHNG